MKEMKPAKKPNRFFPEIDYPDAEEWFAEDYSAWVRSGGTKLARFTYDNRKVPFYKERFEFFEKHFPIGQ